MDEEEKSPKFIKIIFQHDEVGIIPNKQGLFNSVRWVNVKPLQPQAKRKMNSTVSVVWERAWKNSTLIHNKIIKWN